MPGNRGILTWVVCLAALAAASSAEEVITLSHDNFDATVKDSDFIVVEFYAPWCGHCKTLAPEYEKAAVALKGDKSAGREIKLAKMDATIDANRQIAEKYGVGGFPTLKIFANGDTTAPVEYEGPRDADGIVGYLKKRAGPASKELSSADEATALKKEEQVLVVLAAAATESWTSLADTMRDAAAWAHTSDKAVMKALEVKAGSVTLFRTFDKPAVYAGKLDDADALKAFVNEERVEVGMFIKKGDQDAIKVVFEDDTKPNLFLFTDAAKTGLADFKAAATAVKGKFISGHFVSTDFPEAFSHFGMDKFSDAGALPKVLIEDRKAAERYVMASNAVEKATVAAFLKDYDGGKLDAFVKSEKEPVPNDGPVKVIVGDTFADQVKHAGKWVFLEAYAPWCGHCKKLSPIWDELGKAFKDSKVVIAKIDATANDLPKDVNVRGFPTLLLFKGDGSAPHTFDGARDFKGLSSYIEGKTGAKIPADFKPSVPNEPPLQFNDFEKKALKFLASDFQLPWAEEGTTISGLYIAALIVFLLFVAAVSLVIACFAKDPAPKEEAKKEAPKKPEAKKDQ